MTTSPLPTSTISTSECHLFVAALAYVSAHIINIMYLEVFTSHTDKQVKCFRKNSYLVKQKSESEGLLDALYADLAVTLDAFKCHVNEHIWLSGIALTEIHYISI